MRRGGVGVGRGGDRLGLLRSGGLDGRLGLGAEIGKIGADGIGEDGEDEADEWGSGDGGSGEGVELLDGEDAETEVAVLVETGKMEEFVAGEDDDGDGFWEVEEWGDGDHVFFLWES